jgi:hypothetical protein
MYWCHHRCTKYTLTPTHSRERVGVLFLLLPYYKIVIYDYRYIMDWQKFTHLNKIYHKLKPYVISSKKDMGEKIAWDSEPNVSDAISEIKKEIFYPLEEAVEELRRRSNNHNLRHTISEYFRNDIPKHFTDTDICLYLSRHIATPNYEALHFIEIAKQYDLPAIIGQDRLGKFVSINPLKKPLVKMPILSSMQRHEDEIYEHFTIAKINEIEGKIFNSIVTNFNEPLVEFHNNLLREIYPNTLKIADEHDWINSRPRHSLQLQYEYLFSLMTTYGVMFESFPPEEHDFFLTIVYPAYQNVIRRFGIKPLLVELISDEQECNRDWNAYPSVVYSFVNDKMNVHKNIQKD